MKIKVLGTRGEIEESVAYHAKHSGVLIDGKILLDVGEKQFLAEKLRAIFISHLHPDHAFFVRNSMNIDISIYAPEKFKDMNILIPKKHFQIDNYTITVIPTEHSLKVKSQAYLIEKAGKRILYTGDMIWIKKKYRAEMKNLDLVITEGSFVKTGGMVRRDKKTGKIFGHAGIPNLMKYFSGLTKRLLIVHFGAWFYKDMEKSRKKLVEMGSKYDLEVIVGHDGLQISI